MTDQEKIKELARQLLGVVETLDLPTLPLVAVSVARILYDDDPRAYTNFCSRYEPKPPPPADAVK